jgi:RNA polymerase sigma-70 factor, ECF subfamily
MNTSDASPASLPSRSVVEARHEFLTGLYRELHRLAAAKMRFERDNHTLQPTALVHEAYLRLVDGPDLMWMDQTHLLRAAAKVMRHILVDHARAHHAQKRGGYGLQVSLDENLPGSDGAARGDVLAVDAAITQLARFDARQAQILEMYLFAGLTFDEIALQLDVSTRTVKRDWTMARAWLRQELCPAKA